MSESVTKGLRLSDLADGARDQLARRWIEHTRILNEMAGAEKDKSRRDALEMAALEMLEASKRIVEAPAPPSPPGEPSHEEQVERVAKAIWEAKEAAVSAADDDPFVAWEEIPDNWKFDREVALAQARAALEAGFPHLGGPGTEGDSG